MLSVVIPCFDEELVLPSLVARLRPVLDSLEEPYEVIAVDDGSHDATATLLRAYQELWPQLRVRELAANVGHQLALTAGLDVADGEWVVTMDADLQDPPELIPEMLRRGRSDGVGVVYARRHDRASDSFFKRRPAGAYYRLMRRVCDVDIVPDVGDFRLLSRRTVLALRALPERHRVYRLMIPWLGFPSAVVEHRRDPRAAGETKYSLRRMATLAVNSVTSFTTTPLRLSTAVGLTSSAIAMMLAVWAVVVWFAGRTVPGWASLTLVVLFLGSVQLVSLGVLGEYVGRVFQEVQRRPLYTVERDGDAAAVTRVPEQTVAKHPANGG